MNMISNAIENHVSMVVNFSLSLDLRFAIADPIVIKTTETVIKRMCAKPKKAISMFLICSLKFARKNFINGLVKYKTEPIVS